MTKAEMYRRKLEEVHKSFAPKNLIVRDDQSMYRELSVDEYGNILVIYEDFDQGPMKVVEDLRDRKDISFFAEDVPKIMQWLQDTFITKS